MKIDLIQFILLFGAFLSSSSFAQTNSKQNENLIKPESIEVNDVDADIELYVAQFYNLMEQQDSINSTSTSDSLYDAGIEILNKALALNPDRIDIWFSKLEVYMHEKKFTEFMSSVNEFIHRSKQNENQWQEKFNKSLGEKGEEFFSNVTNYIFKLAENGQNVLAEQLADSIIAAYPQDLYYTLIKGQYYISNNEFDKAIENHEAVWTSHKEDLRVAANLAYLYNQVGNTEKLLEICTALELSENEEFAEIGKGYRELCETVDVDFFHIKDYVEANKKEVQTLTERFIEGDETLTLRELSYIYFGHIYLGKNNSSLWKDRNHAKKLYDDGKYEECLNLCRKTLKKHPVSLAASVYVTFCYDAMNKTGQEAENLFLRSRQIGRLIHQGQFKVKGEKGMEGISPYCVLWRADEDVFFDYFLTKEERKNNKIFANPVDFKGN